MAYNNYFPPTYNPNFGNAPYYQQMVQQQQMQMQQRSGFIPIPSEQDARAYPVAPGNSIAFKDESRPYCYVKTMGFSQLDQPTFEKFRLVKEDIDNSGLNAENSGSVQKEYTDITKQLKSEIGAIWGEIKAIKENMEKGTVKDDE